MRLRVCGLACALTVLGSVGASDLASAAPRHNHHLTIAAAPNPVAAGEGVVIYGRLLGPDSGSQTITLYHHVFGGRFGYRRVGTTTTNGAGYYEFTRAEGVVETNRNWFVRGPDGSHSRTMHERVMPLVSINASTTSTDTNHPVLFTGHVDPNHAFERVLLQQQRGNGDDWRTLRSGRLDANSDYAIPYRWRRPDVHDVRVVFTGDERNVRGISDSVAINIEQAQVPGFTINSSDPIAPALGSVTISGVLDQSGTSTPEASTVVQLWGRHPDQGHFVVLQDTTTGSDGSYSFSQPGLTTNTVYYVATLKMPHTPRRHTARLFQGVQDVVTMQASTSSATTDQPVTFTGTVTPDKAGHVIYLQKRGKDGDYHTVAITFVRFDSTFQFHWTIGAPGTHTFRARITRDERNVGAVSPPVSVTASAPPASSLPPAS
jgi:hypothetical protein